MVLSMGEQICMNFDRYLKDLEQQGRCLFLPFEIQSLNVKNIGKFVEKHLEFSKVNIVQGHVGSGKTTIVKAISNVSGYQSIVTSGYRCGEIDLMTSDGKILHQNIFEAGNVQCIVIDDGAEVLDKSHYERFLYHLRGLNLQLILTQGRTELKELISRTFSDCRFIDLD